MNQEIYSMKRITPTAAALLALDNPSAAVEPPIACILNEIKESRRLAIIAPDGLGLLTWRTWKHKMPFLSSLHQKRSIVLEAVMPSVTEVNFACILTGAELAVHGIKKPFLQNGSMINFQCESLYDLVSRAGGRSAGAGMSGYTGELLLARCADYSWVAEKAELSSPLSDMIAEQYNRYKPMFLIAQFGNVDSAFHKFGPVSPMTVPILEELDRSLEKLVKILTSAGTDIILLSDHGQHEVKDPNKAGSHGTHGSDSPEDRLVPCTWIKA